jgi:hypothetical protein
MRGKVDWPDWWSWELDLDNPHLVKRMLDRGFNETELRAMLEVALGFRPDDEPGRWVIETRHGGRPWEVIVEPNQPERRLLVITAYPAEPRGQK